MTNTRLWETFENLFLSWHRFFLRLSVRSSRDDDFAKWKSHHINACECTENDGSALASIQRYDLCPMGRQMAGGSEGKFPLLRRFWKGERARQGFSRFSISLLQRHDDYLFIHDSGCLHLRPQKHISEHWLFIIGTASEALTWKLMIIRVTSRCQSPDSITLRPWCRILRRRSPGTTSLIALPL